MNNEVAREVQVDEDRLSIWLRARGLQLSVKSLGGDVVIRALSNGWLVIVPGGMERKLFKVIPRGTVCRPAGKYALQCDSLDDAVAVVDGLFD